LAVFKDVGDIFVIIQRTEGKADIFK